MDDIRDEMMKGEIQRIIKEELGSADDVMNAKDDETKMERVIDLVSVVMIMPDVLACFNELPTITAKAKLARIIQRYFDTAEGILK